MKKKLVSLFLAMTFIMSLASATVFSATASPNGKFAYAIVSIPITKVVESVSSGAIPETTFEFILDDFNAPIADYNLEGNKITVTKVGSYKEEIKITVYSEDDFWNLSEGFTVKEKTGTAENWDFDTTEWFVVPGLPATADTEAEKSVFYNMTKGDIPYETETSYDGITFTNVYMGTNGGEESTGTVSATQNTSGDTPASSVPTSETPSNSAPSSEAPASASPSPSSAPSASPSPSSAPSASPTPSTVPTSPAPVEELDAYGGEIHEVVFDLGGGEGVPEEEKYPEYTTVDLEDIIPTKEGSTFTGWYSDPECTKEIDEIYVTEDTVVYAGWELTDIPDMLNGVDHNAYVKGYEDATVRPKNNITRAEVAMIFYRLLKEDVRVANQTSENAFEDVTSDKWYNDAISTMAKLGILKGRSANAFEPNADITRAEYTAICSRFDKTVVTGTCSFTDIDGHWAKDDIIHAVLIGWVKGYSDGTFKPNNKITRAEAMTLTNRVLQRNPENTSDLLAGMIVFPDNVESDWYYIAVQEAANSHDYERKANGREKWTALK